MFSAKILKYSEKYLINYTIRSIIKVWKGGKQVLKDILQIVVLILTIVKLLRELKPKKKRPPKGKR